MQRMNFMKFAPVVRIERAKNRMHQNSGLATETSFAFSDGLIKTQQRGAGSLHRFVWINSARNDMFGRFSSGGM